MTDGIKARWYFDVASPLAYLYLKRFAESGSAPGARQVKRPSISSLAKDATAWDG